MKANQISFANIGVPNTHANIKGKHLVQQLASMSCDHTFHYEIKEVCMYLTCAFEE